MKRARSDSSSIKSDRHPHEPYLQPRGLVNHELFLGSLKRKNSVSKIQLSAVQLFDLVTALEAYHTQIATLTTTEISQPKIIPVWGSVAAATIIVLGLTTAAIKIARQPSENAVVSSSPTEPVDIPQLDEVVPPQIPKTENQPTPQPKLTEPLSSAEKLPPPPRVDVLKPQPDIPDPSQYPLPEVAKRSGFQNPSERTNSPQTESTITVPSEETANQPPKPETDRLQSEISMAETETKTEPDPSLNNAPQQRSRQPPEELKQSLEYRLILNANGAIARVIPIGKASKIYLDRTNIPLDGKVFISPLKQQQNATVRLLLSPDGNVNVLSE